ncbi:glucan biosynthesis protein [Phenylobacterium montanum]|uniref:Glucan biosynthesis protein D n=1 Tax=Phenylobacterium montanum TaxID=2823693 RepID=A0A975FWG5_9CAUL|nr:glucan biosynthesis protein D [Caulobacter sp. S6]QUD86406.1 glucan biosynthesis protein D [Caulobacter sp. S6]
MKARAAELARRPFAPTPAPPRNLVEAVDYDAFGAVRYRPDAGLWADPPSDATVRFFHMGRAATQPVAMHVVEGGQARQVIYAENLFDAPADSPARKLGPRAGFAGFRAMNPDQQGDWIAYLGASYFRSADPFNQYGLSARGLAIDTAIDGAEEFPSFTAFWLEKDAQGRLLVHALLNGPSCTGAFRILHDRPAKGGLPGLTQTIQVQLNFRKAVTRLGLAPLTSMYWYGQSDRTPTDDWRPQIHDSDGLSIWTGAGERLWRPLANPPRVTTNLFFDKGPRGFGLMQRDRQFQDYQDDGVFYEKRPSVWVEPVGDWGEGSVQLVQIPTTGETDDNIVAFWTPSAPVHAASRLDYGYRLLWTGEEPGPFGVARVVATRQGRSGRPGLPAIPGRRKFVIDFEGSGLAGLDRSSGVQPVVEARPGRIVDPVAYPVVGTPRWRLAFDAETTGLASGAAVELRAYLRRGSAALTETWSYQAFAA